MLHVSVASRFQILVEEYGDVISMDADALRIFHLDEEDVDELVICELLPAIVLASPEDCVRKKD